MADLVDGILDFVILHFHKHNQNVYKRDAKILSKPVTVDLLSLLFLPSFYFKTNFGGKFGKKLILIML